MIALKFRGDKVSGAVKEACPFFHVKKLLLLLAGRCVEVYPDCQKGAQTSNEGHHLVKKGPTKSHEFNLPSRLNAAKNNAPIHSRPNITLVHEACPLTSPPTTAISPTPLAMS